MFEILSIKKSNSGRCLDVNRLFNIDCGLNGRCRRDRNTIVKGWRLKHLAHCNEVPEPLSIGKAILEIASLKAEGLVGQFYKWQTSAMLVLLASSVGPFGPFTNWVPLGMGGKLEPELALFYFFAKKTSLFCTKSYKFWLREFLIQKNIRKRTLEYFPAFGRNGLKDERENLGGGADFLVSPRIALV